MPLNPESFIFAIPSRRWGWIPAWWSHTDKTLTTHLSSGLKISGQLNEYWKAVGCRNESWGESFSEGSHSCIRSISCLSVELFPKTYEIFVISLQCLVIVIFHDMFERVLRFA